MRPAMLMAAHQDEALHSGAPPRTSATTTTTILTNGNGAAKAPPPLSALTNGNATNGTATTPTTNGAAVPPATAMKADQEIDARGHSEPLRTACLSMEATVRRFLAEEDLSPRLQRVQKQVRIAMDVIRQALEIYTPIQLSLSYNGGKDCLVLLILILASLPSQKYPPGQFPKTLQSIYIVSHHPFPEVDTFVDTTCAQYGLSLTRIAGLGMKAALRQYLDVAPGIKAVFVGTRRTDPHGEKLKFFDETDDGWPRFMRVHPVIDWHYAEIWAFIRHLQIPYCPLYDQGYTSLGGTTDTHPNPALRLKANNVGGTEAFRPAYELYEDEAERLGRDN